MQKYSRFVGLLIFLGCITAAWAVQAQTAAPGGAVANPAAPVAATPQAPAVPNIALTPEEKNAFFEGAFLMGPAEIAAIQRALQGNVSMGASLEEDAIIPLHRVISIAGVYYRSAKDWIVWMNGKKVTPQKLLPEIMEIKVHDSSRVSLKWYDVGLKKVISITLRPHQTYDIPTGILLPRSE